MISAKGGGSGGELKNYLSTLNNRSPFIQNLILTQYYFDLVHMQDYEDNGGKIKSFLNGLKHVTIDNEELYKYELYLLLYWISNNLKLKSLESHYKKNNSTFLGRLNEFTK